MYNYLRKYLLPTLRFVGIMPRAGGVGPGNVGLPPPDECSA